MPIFNYMGQNATSGKKIKAKIEADSIKDAKIKLRKQNIYVMEITQDSKANAARSSSSLLTKLMRKPPSQEDIAIATKQFAIMTRAAVDISECLKSLSEQVENEELRSVYQKLRELVSEGKSLSDAHREFPKVFSSIYINMIAAAEKSGALPIVLRRLSEFIEYQLAIKRKVTGALTYPAIMVLVSVGVTIFLFVNVLPKITKAFKSLKVTLPWYSILINNISAWMQDYWHVSLITIAGIIAIFVWWSKTPKGRYKVDKFMLTAPVIGPLVSKVAVSRFSKTLSTVLSSGVRIVEALTLTRLVIGNAVLEESITEAISRVQDGEKFGAAMEKTGRFPVMVIQMIRTGEKTGKLEDMLVNVAEAYDDEVEHQISQSTKLIEPIMMVFMAGLVFVIVMSVLGPMMQAMNSLK